MLLNATHSIGFRRLPSELLDLYVRYKQGTRAIIIWLVQQSTRKCSATITIRDLLDLCEVVCARPVTMPESIDFYFRDTISARRRLTRFFQREGAPRVDNEEMTTTHEYFTTCLTKMYTGLYQCCSKPQKDCMQNDSGRTLRSVDKVHPNKFTLLSDSCLSNASAGKSSPIESQRLSCTISDPPSTMSQKDIPRLIDDQLGEACELCNNFEKIDGLVLGINKCWEKAARHESSVLVAAHITNIAFAAFEEIDHHLRTECGILSPEDLRRKTLHLQNKEYVVKDSKNSALTTPWEVPERLYTAWRLLIHSKACHQRRQTCLATRATQQPSQVILRRGEETDSADQNCIAMILKDVENHISIPRIPTSVVRLGSPLYAELGYFLSHDEAGSKSIRCCFGLQVFLESYKSYLFAAHLPSTYPNCRVQALRFAQEAEQCIRAVLRNATMPCRCFDTLAYHLENLHKELDHFLHERAFDLYFQSPWVSGSHVLEMLESSFYYGLRLVSYRLYVPSVCHTYNALRRCTALEPVPLLEALCNTLKDVLFPRGFPERNFKASFSRYKGARLRFDPHSHDHKSGNHHMTVPAHTAKATAGFGSHKEVRDPRFDYRKISLFHSIKKKGYRLDDDLWTRVYDLADAEESKHAEEHPKQSRDSQRRRSSSDHTAASTQDRLAQLEKAMLREFTGPFPIAKINIFEVYLACVRIVGIINDKMHEEKCRGINCLCFAEVLLDAADCYKENEHKLQPFGYKELVEASKNAMAQVLGEQKLDEYLWKTI